MTPLLLSLGGWAYGLAALLALIVMAGLGFYADRPQAQGAYRNSSGGGLAILMVGGFLFVGLSLGIGYLRAAKETPAERVQREQAREQARAQTTEQYELRASEDRMNAAADPAQLASASTCVKEELKRTLSRGVLVPQWALSRAERMCATRVPSGERALLNAQWQALDADSPR